MKHNMHTLYIPFPYKQRNTLYCKFTLGLLSKKCMYNDVIEMMKSYIREDWDNYKDINAKFNSIQFQFIDNKCWSKQSEDWNMTQFTKW